MKKLSLQFFRRKDTLAIAQDLLGKFLVSSLEGNLTSGMIVEAEAYLGHGDRASHAFGGRRTKRTEVLYLEGGHLYVYLCYGLHSLLNIITHQADVPHGILIRALEPSEGIDIMLKRRHMTKSQPRLTSGPGSVSVALGITTHLSGEMLGKRIWVEDRGVILSPDQIIAGPRIGVDYAKEDALLPYRFRIKDNRWTTK